MIKLGVIGVGSMGAHHASIGARLLGHVNIYDPLQRQLDIPQVTWMPSLESMETCDALIIATPTSTHHAIGSYFLSRGKHCLIEKPLATCEQEARDLAELAQKHQVVLSVGHIEHFNPAIAAFHRDGPHQLRYIQGRRWAYVCERTDFSTSVVMDMMIHDLALLQYWMPECKIQDVRWQQYPKDPWGHVDVWLSQGSILAHLSASRWMPCKERSLMVRTDQALYQVDCLRQECIRHRHNQNSSLLEQKKLEYEKHNALEKEIEHFLACIRHPSHSVISALNGCHTVRLAEEIHSWGE